MFIDSHCHLQHCFNQSEIQEKMLELSNKLLYIIDISININEILFIKKLKLPENILSAFGLYPEYADSYNRKLSQELIQMITQLNPRALGEIGLDYYHQYGTKEKQEYLFREQIEIAINFNLPVIIHSREAFSDTYRILSAYHFNQAVILHCFGYGLNEAEKFIEKGYFISFAGNLTYKNAKSLQDVSKIIPLDQLLLETDSPYLSPEPHRGKNNTPLKIEFTYKYLAELRKMEVSDLALKIKNNFLSIFNLK